MLRHMASGVEEDYSQPILPGGGASDYERYLRTDDLLALQKTPEEMVHRDELLFQTVHQSSELWLKLGCFEVETATEHVRAHEVAAALRLLRRASDCLRIATQLLDMLEHMSPWEYQTIRAVLGHRSEEHTSELQLRENLVCRLLLEKKKKPTGGPPRETKPDRGRCLRSARAPSVR